MYGYVFIDVDGMVSGSVSFAGADLYFRQLDVFLDELLLRGSLGRRLGRFVDRSHRSRAPGKRRSRELGGHFRVVVLFWVGIAVRASSTAFSSCSWGSGGTGFVGFRFENNSNTYYGWARLDINPGGLDGEVIDFAYEDSPNTPIATGVIPEPSSLSLLALGTVGLTALRRRRRTVRGSEASD